MTKKKEENALSRNLELTEESNQMLQYAERSSKLKKIETTEDMQKAGSLRSEVQQYIKGLEETRLKIVGPFNAQIKYLNGEFKKVSEPLKKIAGELSSSMNDFAREEAKREEEAAALEKKKREEEALERAEKFESAGRSDIAEEIVQEEETRQQIEKTKVKSGPIRTKTASISTVKTWTFKIESLMSVPQTYLMLDEKKVREAIRQGIRQIPGLEIYQDVQTRVRKA